MVMSASEWDGLNSRLPAEDQMSYQDYLAAVSATSTPTPTSSATITPTSYPTYYWNDIYGDGNYSSINGSSTGSTVITSPAVTSPAVTSPAVTSPATSVTTVTTTTTTTTSNIPSSGLIDFRYTSPFGNTGGFLGGGGGFYGGTSPFPFTPTNPSTPVKIELPPPPVKTAPIDTILAPDDSVPIEIMADLIFENIGGQEIINVARTDTVNGQNIIYQPIKNLTQIQQQYNPNNIVTLQSASDKYFQNFPIKLENKVPLEGNGIDGSFVYIDPVNGDLVIEGINLGPDEQIEAEITTGGTIYEVEL